MPVGVSGLRDLDDLAAGEPLGRLIGLLPREVGDGGGVAGLLIKVYGFGVDKAAVSGAPQGHEVEGSDAELPGLRITYQFLHLILDWRHVGTSIGVVTWRTFELVCCLEF